VASGCGGAIRHALASETAVGLGVLALNGVDNRLLLLKSLGGVLGPLVAAVTAARVAARMAAASSEGVRMEEMMADG
jgi:hypothetical protein